MILNLTPHEITIVRENGEVIHSIEPEKDAAKLGIKRVLDVPIDGIPISKIVFGAPENLPEAKEGVFLIVPHFIKSAYPLRTDLLVTAETVKNHKGKTVGCKSLGR